MSTLRLFPPQQEVLNNGLLTKPEHCLLNMTTGSGKTFLSEIAIESVLEKGYKAIYVTPLRALAAQQFNEFKARFKEYKVGLFTGETIQNQKTGTGYLKSQLMIMTPERLDACMRNWHSHWNWIPDVSLIVIDEFHTLGQGHRGARLEGTITRFIRLNPFVKILGLSATMPNASQLSEWLQGTFYQTNWRRVPFEKKVIRFKTMKEKPALLLKHLNACLDSGGQSLVFCNSRSRVQAIMVFLRENGIKAACHHAGLLPDERSKVENGFRNRTIHVLVSTSTLEMGLNLPARQVIIYDSYSFSETGFAPLPVWSFIQRAGRAGRPGLDDYGEIIIMLPQWESGAEKYIAEECEPVVSQLNNTKCLIEQILIDVYAGYSRTQNELQNGFLPLTLYGHEHPDASIANITNRLVLSDLLYEKEEENCKERILRVGLLGRMAVKLMFAPDTIRMARDAHNSFRRLYIFDVLMLAAMSEDCNPILQVNYEEMDHLCDIVQPLTGSMLDNSLEELKKKIPDSPSTVRLLSAIKMAAICYRITQGDDIKDLADEFDLYEADIRMLQESMIRVLTGLSAVYTAIDRSELDEEQLQKAKQEITRPAVVCTMVANMLQYEINCELVSLTQLKGIGGKLAKRLAEKGYSSIRLLSETDPLELSEIDGIGGKLAKSVVDESKRLIDNGNYKVYSEEEYDDWVAIRDIKTDIDPYRLRRSLELKIRGHEGAKYCITGGHEDHIVLFRKGQYTCDCLDYEKHEGKMDCKHILCVRRARGDREINRMVKMIKEDTEHSIRESLPTMWFSIAGERKH